MLLLPLSLTLKQQYLYTKKILVPDAENIMERFPISALHFANTFHTQKTPRKAWPLHSTRTLERHPLTQS